MDDDTSQSVDSIRNLLIEALNHCKLANKEKKVQYLVAAFEYAFHRDKTLLGDFLDEFLLFSCDRNVNMRKQVVIIIEQVCKDDDSRIVKCFSTLIQLVEDDSAIVSKRVITVVANLWRPSLHLVLSNEQLHELWEMMCQMKEKLVSMLTSSKNDGIITQILKFLETVVMTFSHFQVAGVRVGKRMKTDTFSLDDIPASHTLLQISPLTEESRSICKQIIQFPEKASSSTNVIVAISCMGRLGKFRYSLFPDILDFFTQIYSVLMEKKLIGESHVKSIVHSLKSNIIPLFNLPAAVKNQNAHQRLLDVLKEIGATKEADTIQKKFAASTADKDNNLASTPVGVLSSKRKNEEVEIDGERHFKRLRNINDVNDTGLSFADGLEMTFPGISSNIPINNVIDVIFTVFQNMPPPAPLSTPVNLRQRLESLICSLTDSSGQKFEGNNENNNKEYVQSQYSMPFTSASEKIDPRKQKVINLQESENLKSVIAKGAVGMAFGQLPFVFDPLLVTKKNCREIGEMAFRRIIEVPDNVLNSSPNGKVLRSSTLSFFCLSLSVDDHLLEEVINFIARDFRGQCSFLLNWLYCEFIHDPEMQTRYSKILTAVLNRMKEAIPPSDRLFSEIILKIPAYSNEGLEIIRECCDGGERSAIALISLRDLVLTRPALMKPCLEWLCEFSTNPNNELRSMATRLLVNQLFSKSSMNKLIEDFAIKSFSSLVSFEIEEGEEGDNSAERVSWASSLFLALCTRKKSLLLTLATTYSKCSTVVQKCLHVQMNGLISLVSSISPSEAVYKLLENFPPGSKQFVLHILHRIAEKGVPIPRVIEAIKAVYKRTSDANFIVPIAHGIQKEDILESLPLVISLPKNTIRIYLQRLFPKHRIPSIQPADFLFVLIQLCFSEESKNAPKIPLRAIIDTTNLCMDMTDVFKQEVFAVVLQRLADLPKIPILMMRLMIQVVPKYPKLLNFTMSILIKLMKKFIWKDPRLWEGFVKFVKITIPLSLGIVLQLPKAQLEDCLSRAPELKEPMLVYIEKSKSSIPSWIIDYLGGNEEQHFSISNDLIS